MEAFLDSKAWDILIYIGIPLFGVVLFLMVVTYIQDYLKSRKRK